MKIRCMIFLFGCAIAAYVGYYAISDAVVVDST